MYSHGSQSNAECCDGQDLATVANGIDQSESNLVDVVSVIYLLVPGLIQIFLKPINHFKPGKFIFSALCDTVYTKDFQ